ncbi:MAG TPA: hypothetical protein VL485_23240 [Ktedonobacteraceae bacterium]|jgi:hypothetical protein|nr:hypothetical protein [Ktedonobacteraceae bacterium]
MFWSLITKILMGALVDILVGLLVKVVLTAGSALYKSYCNTQQQASFA